MITTKVCVCVAILLVVVLTQNNAEATLDAPCTDMDTSNCTAPSEQCTSGTCSCSSDYYGNGSVCSQKIDLGTSCNNMSECKATNASCTNSTCQCLDDFYPTDSKTCEQKLDFDADCQVSPTVQQCKNPFLCANTVTTAKCLCGNGLYHNGSGNCQSVNNLIPTFEVRSSDLNTITIRLLNKPTVLSQYTSSYTASISPAGSTQAVNENVDGDAVLVGLASGTLHTITITRTIVIYGWSKDTSPSDPHSFRTKGRFKEGCSSATDCKTEGQNTFVCYDFQCLCAVGSYYTGNLPCQDINNLKPTFEVRSSDLNTITIRLLNRLTVLSQYTSSYTANISPEGSTQAVNENVDGDAVLVGLASGTRYTITITRTIVIHGWSKDTSPSDPHSFRTKGRFTEGCSNATDCKTEGVNPFVCQDSRCLCAAGFYYNGALCQDKIRYGQPCTSNDTCVNTNADCYGDKCLCKVDYYWNNEATNCNSISDLRPTGVGSESVTTNSVVITWAAPAYISYISGYRVHARPVEASDPGPVSVPVSETSKEITGLQPGTRYNASVESRSDNDGRTQFVPASTLVTVITVPATVPGLDRDKSNFSSPSMIIGFQQADGKVSSYQVNLKGDNYDETLPANTVLRTATFFGIKAGRSYTVTILTYSNNIASAPFTEMVKAFPKQSGPVRDLHGDNTTSRDALVTWRKPKLPNGQLFQYSLEIAENDSPNVCLFRALIVCAECRGDNVTFTDLTNCDGVKETLNITQANIMNDGYIVSYKVTGLKPDTSYSVTVAAYNQEGRGQPDTDKFATKIEAAGPPTDLKATPITSSTVTLKWKPPVPRPGNTFYNVSVHEQNEGDTGFHFKSSQYIDGYENDTTTFEELSSYWYYKFHIYAATAVLPYSDAIDITVRTEESAPIEAEYFVIQGVPNTYNAVQVSWKCPKQKDGRNGQITGASLKYQVTDQTAENTVSGDYPYFNEDNCVWNQMITVTPEFNYTFTVYLRNSFDGARSTKHRYIPAGPPDTAIAKVVVPSASKETTQTTVHVTLNPVELYNRQNAGYVTKTGIIVCKNSCQARKKRATMTANEYDSMATWKASKGNEFNAQYRATPEDWISPDDKQKTSLQYVLGSDKTCDEKGDNVYCNGELPAGTTFQVFVFACTAAGCTNGDPVAVNTLDNPTNIGLIVGVIVAVVVVFVLVGVIIWLVRRKNTEHEPFINPVEEEKSQGELIEKKRPIKIKEFEKHVDDMHRDSNLLFSEEFEDIGTLSPKHSCNAAEVGGNKLRNRYVNILPFDHTRIKLLTSDEDEEETDYINANYIPGYNSPREFIATQGPMTSTIPDFWRMIWEQKVPIIVMLSDFSEKGKPKVDRYFPENISEPVSYGDIAVELINFSPLSKYIIRIFKLTLGEETRQIRHYFLPEWQDFGANLTSDDVISFVQSVRMEVRPHDQGPVCVHCSAGVGRTGTYISLDVFQQHIDENNLDKKIDVFDFVMTMRENRSHMVQTEKQYIFIHDTIKEMIIRKRRELAEKENIYVNSNFNADENVYANQGYDADPQDLYMNVELKAGQPTTVL